MTHRSASTSPRKVAPNGATWGRHTDHLVLVESGAQPPQSDAEREDLENRYLMNELPAEERALVDAWRRADPAFDDHLRELERVAALLTLLTPEEVCEDDGWDLPPLDGLETCPLELDDGGVAGAPDAVQVPGAPGIRASELVAGAEAEGFVHVRSSGFRYAYLARAGARPVLMPFDEAAWLGPRVAERYGLLLLEADAEAQP
jgi:hypothetical protein